MATWPWLVFQFVFHTPKQGLKVEPPTEMGQGKGPMDPFKGFGKGGYPAPKEAKGLVRSIVSSQVGPGGLGFAGFRV